MVHHAKVDFWLALLLGAAAAGEFIAAASVLAGGIIKGDPVAALGTSAVFAGAGAFIAVILWGCYRTRYEVTPPDLIIRFGPLRKSLPLESIVEVFPTHNPLSAPAPSLDRLRVNYHRKTGKLWFALISPKDKEAFCRDLAGAASHLRRDPDRLRLKAASSSAGG